MRFALLTTLDASFWWRNQQFTPIRLAFSRLSPETRKTPGVVSHCTWYVFHKLWPFVTVGSALASRTRPCPARAHEADQSLTRDTARDREFETLGIGARFGGGGRESRLGSPETTPARDVGGSGCGDSRFDEKSRRVSTAAF